MGLRMLGAGLVLMVLGAGSAGAQSLEAQLAVADPATGANVYRRCRSCHTIEEGGPSRVGPNLWATIGRPVASVDGYAYSNSMQAYGGVWDAERLDHYLAEPREAVPGTTMAFTGLPRPADRANLIAFLNQNSPEPVSFAPADGEPAAGAAVGEPGEADYGLLVDAPGVEETFVYCTPCHSEMIVVQQGKTRKHWENAFAWMIEEQGMAPIEEPDMSIVLDYLAANYNEDRPNFPKR